MLTYIGTDATLLFSEIWTAIEDEGAGTEAAVSVMDSFWPTATRPVAILGVTVPEHTDKHTINTDQNTRTQTQTKTKKTAEAHRLAARRQAGQLAMAAHRRRQRRQWPR